MSEPWAWVPGAIDNWRRLTYTYLGVGSLLMVGAAICAARSKAAWAVLVLVACGCTHYWLASRAHRARCDLEKIRDDLRRP